MRLKLIILIFAFTLAFSIAGKCQCLTINLIKNPSLEEYTCCPVDISLINCANYWLQPLYIGSSDYFNLCAYNDSAYIPYDVLLFFNKTPAYGKGEAGIFCYRDNNSIIEYIEGTLSEPLQKNTCYYAEFYTLLSNYSTAAIDAIGIHFSDTAIRLNYDTIISGDTISYRKKLYYNTVIENIKYNVLSDTMTWMKISGYFYAHGGEKYFIVGNFKEDSDVTVNKFIPNEITFSYYFFDNFSLCPCEDTIPPKETEAVVYIPNIFSPNGDGQNDVLYMRGINIQELHFSIYNRWGEKVFETQNKNEGWNGNYKDKQCPPGVYYYMAEVTFANGEKVMKKGNVTLVR